MMGKLAVFAASVLILGALPLHAAPSITTFRRNPAASWNQITVLSPTAWTEMIRP